MIKSLQLSDQNLILSGQACSIGNQFFVFYSSLQDQNNSCRY